MYKFLPPLFLLTRNVGSAYDWFVGVDEEERKDLAMAGLARVLKMEWLHAVLEDLRLCQLMGST